MRRLGEIPQGMKPLSASVEHIHAYLGQQSGINIHFHIYFKEPLEKVE